MIHYVNGLKFYARAMWFFGMLYFFLWLAFLLISIVFSSQIISLLPELGVMMIPLLAFALCINLVIPMGLWGFSFALRAIAAMIVDLDRRRKPSAPEVDNVAYQRPQSEKSKVYQDQPPRQRLEKKPALEPRLYSRKWQGGKAQRAVRKTVIE